MHPISSSEFLRQVPVAALKEGSIFGAFSDAAILYLIENGILLSAERGDMVFDYGDRGDSFFIICKGSVDFFKHHEGACMKTRTVRFGEELGFVSMIALHDHTGQAVVQEDTILLKVSSALFSDLHRDHPSDFGIITLNLARDMARTLRKLSNDLVKLSTCSEGDPTKQVDKT